MSIMDSSDEENNGTLEPSTANNSHSQDTENEEEEVVSTMLQSMGSISQVRPESPPPNDDLNNFVINDPLVLFDMFKNNMPSFTF